MAAGRSEVAAFVAAMSADLSVLARRNRLSTLAYLLDMARLEAESAARAGDEGGAPNGSAPGPELS